MPAHAFSSIWTADTPYWIIVHCTDAAVRARIAPSLSNLKTLHQDQTLLGFQTKSAWAAAWEHVATIVQNLEIASCLRATVMSSELLPSMQEIMLALRPFSEIDAIANNLWLAHALREERLICCMQKVSDRRGKHVGFEAFARIEMPDGNVVGGAAVMQASHALRIEYHVDRLLHKQAIKCFVEFDLEGFVFINFLTGFIHRPEVYLEGLSQAVDQYHLLARSVVLDVPLADYSGNTAKIKTIADYCRSRGFAMALDDVTSPANLANLLADIRPAFVKLDGRLGVQMLDVKKRGSILDIIRTAHDAGASVLAEGVESAALYDAYFAAGVDMFQGYYISEPERYPPAPKKRKAG